MSTQMQSICLAGGCFWGMQELVRQLAGVVQTEVGYCGGEAQHANYENVKTGRTNHAEALKVVFDPQQISLRKILFEFFRMHNPTTSQRQGNDIGAQYRSAIFYLDEQQKQCAQEVINAVEQSGDWEAALVTELQPLSAFYAAEDYHQDYLQKHPQGYNCHYRRQLGMGES